MKLVNVPVVRMLKLFSEKFVKSQTGGNLFLADIGNLKPLCAVSSVRQYIVDGFRFTGCCPPKCL